MKIKKNTIIILSAVLIRLLIVGLIFNSFWIKIGSVNPYVVEKNIVYVPEKTPRRFHYNLVGVFFGNDHFEYWVIKPNKSDREALLEDIEYGNWSNFNSQYDSVLYYYNYYGDEFTKPAISKPLNSESTYICYYDDVNEEIVCDFDESFITSQWIIYIYDSAENIYYCIHQSV